MNSEDIPFKEDEPTFEKFKPKVKSKKSKRAHKKIKPRDDRARKSGYYF